MKTVKFHTMDAIGYSRMIVTNACMDHFAYEFNQYPSFELDVPCPSVCPSCGKTLGNELYPIMAINNINPDQKEQNIVKQCSVVSIYRCSSCNQLFAIWSEHNKTDEANDAKQSKYVCTTKYIYPDDAPKTTFSQEILELSNEFVAIYKQSECAESHGLNEICGMGYRRALEFLVDAYIRHIHSEQSIDANLPLSTKISKFIDDPKIQTLAQKSAWLCNDATHIVIKHPDREVGDIKKFIKAIVTMIDAEFAYEDADTIEKK